MCITYFSGKRTIVVNLVNDPIFTDDFMKAFVEANRLRQHAMEHSLGVKFTFNTLTRELTIEMIDIDDAIAEYILQSLNELKAYKNSVTRLSEGLKKFIENWDK